MHSDLLLATADPHARRVVMTLAEALSLVSAFDSLLEERDALSARARAAETERGELASLVGSALVYATLDSLAGDAPAETPTHAITSAVWSLVQERDAALQRASTAESELVRMSERMEAMRARVEAVSSRVWQARAVNWNCGGPANRTPTRTDAPEGSWMCWPEWEQTMLGHLDAAAEMADAALRSLVNESAPTNDKEKTR